MTHEDWSVTRRGLVVAGGAATAGAPWLLAGGSAQATTTVARPARPLQVGLLVPGRPGDAAAGSDFSRGLAAGFAARARPVVVQTRVVLGGYSGAAAEAADLVAQGCQVVVAGVTLPVLDRVAEACTEGGAGLLVAHVGAHLQTAPVRGTVVTSLQHWQSALTMGRWSARRLGGRLFQIVAAPDAGYDSVYAFTRGFQAAGGRLTGRVLSHQTPSDVEQAAAAARDSGAAVVVVNASGNRARELVVALREHGVRSQVVVDPLMCAPHHLASLGAAAKGLWAAGSWTGTSAQRDLGYDAALLVDTAARRLSRSGRRWSSLSPALAGARVAGSRGLQVVHGDLGAVSTPLVVRQVRRTRRGLAPVVVDRRPRVSPTAPAMALRARAQVAAYVNEYATT